MKTYRQLLGNITYNGAEAREETEWSNYWYDKANEPHSKKRYLIIGDSTARMVRSTFAKYTGCPTDMLGTSSMLDDELFVSQMDAFFSKTIYQYDVCFLQIGHHGRIGKDGNEFTEIDLEKYGKDLHHLIVFLKQYAKEVVVESIFDSIKPSKNAFVPTKLATNIRHYLMQIGFYKECPNIKINTITQWKNIKAKEVVSNISQQMGGGKMV